MSRYRKSGGEGQAAFLSNSFFLNGQSPNAEQVHLDALAAAQAEHERVREAAIRVYRNNELREARSKLEAAARQEQERLKLEAEQARLAAQVIELQKKQIRIPKPPPREPTPPPPPSPPKKVEAPLPIPQPKPDPPQEPQRPLQNGGSSHSFHNTSTPVQEPSRPAANNFTFPTNQNKPLSNFPAQQPQVPPAPTSKSTVQRTDQSHVFPEAQRYVEIHKRLKELRAFMADAGKQNQELKKKMGEMRREIRKSVGQITEGKAANKIPMNRIVNILKAALYEFPSPPADGQMFVVNFPPRQEDAKNNGEQLPTLFIYLLNIFAKSVVSQFIDEAGVNPKAADPIGVIAVSIFAQGDLLWRGTSLIDILLAKLRVACPVLFGLRGSEKTEAGRARLGWKKDDQGHWLSDQVHYSRMSGLAAGYAAISLRDFSKSRLKNPYPPSNYWRTLAAILDTPAQDASDTQYTVVKALIENFEHAFMKFYGDMAVIMIQYAVVDFPSLAVEKSVAVSALQVLGEKLKRDMGLRLPPPPQQRAANNNAFRGFR